MGAKSGIEKRRYTRYDVENVQGRIRFALDAKIVNLSLSGIALETASWLTVGGNYSLNLNSGNDQLVLTGRVAWCRLVRTAKNDKGESQPIYAAGIAFDSTLSEKANDLLSFIEENATVGVESRLFGRFKTRREESVNIATERDFAVKKLSQGGMLIEADFLPEVGSRFDINLGGGEDGVPVMVEVVNIRLQQGRHGPPRTEIGLKFVKMTDEARRGLRELIHREVHGLGQPEPEAPELAPAPEPEPKAAAKPPSEPVVAPAPPVPAEDIDLELPAEPAAVLFRGNPKSKIFHLADCPRAGKGATVELATKRKAKARGYRPARCCNP